MLGDHELDWNAPELDDLDAMAAYEEDVEGKDYHRGYLAYSIHYCAFDAFETDAWKDGWRKAESDHRHVWEPEPDDLFENEPGYEEGTYRLYH